MATKYYAKYLDGKDYSVNDVLIKNKETEVTKEINDYLKDNPSFKLSTAGNNKGKA